MKTIDKTKPVLVTGATGYIAGWLVKRLLEEGITVHAAVRNPDNKEKLKHLDEIAAQTQGTILYFKADLLTEGAYADAMNGCQVVFHTASPFTLDIKDPQKELVDPAVKGTQNVLEQANKTPSVKRVVVTSSCAAIYTDAIDCLNAPDGILTEKIWNTTSSLDYQPYSYSKTLAEKKAWEISKAQNRWTLVTINPSLVLGPALNPDAVTSESFSIFKQLGDGSMKIGVPDMGIGFVDVRDVAEAHYLAAYNPDAKGRYITSAHNTSFLKIAHILHEKYGAKYPIPKKALPKWLLVAVGPIIDKRFSRKYMRNNINIAFHADNSKIKHELGLRFKSSRETLEDTFQQMIDEKMI